VLLRLLSKAAARLRANDLWTAAMAVSVGGYKQSWQSHTRVPPTQDSLTLTDALLEMWQDRDFDSPRSVGVTFYDLRSRAEFTPSLFDPTEDRSKLSHAVDQVNQKFGKNKVFLASQDKVKHTAEEKIAFNKTWLFSEGKGDNEWIDGFRGVRTD
jgi:DNA polymerase-4